MKLVLDPGEPDWKFGDVLRLRRYDRKHEYLYMFAYRKPRMYMDDDFGDVWKAGDPNDRGFAAVVLGVPDCPYPAGRSLYPCHFDHSCIGHLTAALGGLPCEENWELVESA